MAVAGSLTYDTDIDKKGFEKGLGKLESATTQVGKDIAIAMGAVVSATSAVVVASVKARGELEQQIGGVNKLFEDSANLLIENANKAYLTAGVSATEYMQNATSFSASLINSLGGDTKKAAELVDVAMRDMSDNANTYGTDLASIQNAYQGFAKQNYTMLD